MTNQNVTVTFWREAPSKPGRDPRTEVEDFSGTVIHIDQTGVGHIRLPANATAVALRAGPKMGSEPYRIPYTDCNENLPDRIGIGTVQQQGFVPGNQCNPRLKIKAGPGEIVFFATPIPWWKPDLQ